MERVKQFVHAGVKNLALPTTVSAYHIYYIDFEHTKQRELIYTQNALMLEEVRTILAEERELSLNQRNSPSDKKSTVRNTSLSQ